MGEYPLANGFANPVVGGIAQNCSNRQQEHQQSQVHLAGGAECPADEQQRIAREEEQNNEAGLAKDDGKQQCIDIHAVLRDQGTHRTVYVNQHVQQLNEIHYLSQKGCGGNDTKLSILQAKIARQLRTCLETPRRRHQ